MQASGGEVRFFPGVPQCICFFLQILQPMAGQAMTGKNACSHPEQPARESVQ